jgi:hypothetical protein
MQTSALGVTDHLLARIPGNHIAKALQTLPPAKYAATGAIMDCFVASSTCPKSDGCELPLGVSSTRAGGQRITSGQRKERSLSMSRHKIARVPCR